MNFLTRTSTKICSNYSHQFRAFETSHVNLKKMTPNRELTGAVNLSSNPIFKEKAAPKESVAINGVSYDKETYKIYCAFYDLLSPVEQKMIDQSYDSPL